MRVARWCGLCRDLILSGIDKFLMRSCTVTLFSQTTLSVFSRHPPNYWSKCTKTLIILTCSEASLVGLIKLPGIPTPLLPYAQPFSFCNWRLHFVPTSYSGKVTKGHRPMLNRKFLLIQKLSWGLFFTPSATRGLLSANILVIIGILSLILLKVNLWHLAVVILLWQHEQFGWTRWSILK